MDRRRFLKLSSAVSTGLVISTQMYGCSSKHFVLPENQVEFNHGVASGDPTQSAIVLWTRATPANSQDTQVHLVWQLAKDSSFTQIVREGSAQASKATDYTVKVDVRDLEENQAYFYRFITQKNSSVTGTTRTLPKSTVEQVKLGIFSCSNYPAGFFNPYMAASQDSEIDVVLHLGDYIYEYSSTGYATEDAQRLGRTFDKDNQGELFTLDDYRKRYATYRTDKGLQALHQAKPFIVVWDDHEVANDTYNEGAENHNEGEGDFFARRAAAVKAYYEWLPIRPPMGDTQPHIYRTFEFGDLIALHMLDTRVIGRDKQLEYGDYRNTETGEFDTDGFVRDMSDASRSLLGSEQRDWLINQVKKSPSHWQVLGQQVLMGKMHYPAEIFAGQNREKIPQTIEQLVGIKQKQLKGETLSDVETKRLTTTMPYNLDAWDGYPVEREMIYGSAKQANKQLVVFAGDTHNGWCSDLVDNNGEIRGIEFATAGVSSPGIESYLKLSDDTAKNLSQALPQLIKDLTYCNLHQRGYLTVTFTREEAQAHWYYVDTIKSEDFVIADEHTVTFQG